MMEPNKKAEESRPAERAERVLRFDPPHPRLPKPLMPPWGKDRPQKS